ncbi:S49 family peptidase [Ruficoccus sp. ZRK36]|uniref:S49 family peptidase n=1 Tax=Ruficoccus sp. ZRK36 TaxID=2866311 RepID=UPI001C737E92|nr:S49 family peptidase [Ruficoccus sp. ZRK36]QYY34600.1 S49 family peptidase [Ruficoccus sp. ZRK36]
MRFAHILHAVYREPWNITTSGWLSIHEILQGHLSGEVQNLDLSAFVNPRPDLEIDSQGIGHVHVTGVLGKNLSQIERACGNTGYEQIKAEIADAVESGARGIMLHVNSPGGAASGNVETSRFVADCGVPTVAWVDELAASAAYAIAAGASRIVAAPSAQVGSIGTILPLVDTSGQWEQRGWKPAYITHTGGDLKDATWPPNFSEAHRAHLQEMVDDYFGQFREHVLAHRAVQQSAMRGQTFLSERAKAANLIDRIGSYADAYEEINQRVNA